MNETTKIINFDDQFKNLTNDSAIINPKTQCDSRDLNKDLKNLKIDLNDRLVGILAVNKSVCEEIFFEREEIKSLFSEFYSFFIEGKEGERVTVIDSTIDPEILNNLIKRETIETYKVDLKNLKIFSESIEKASILKNTNLFINFFEEIIMPIIENLKREKDEILEDLDRLKNRLMAKEAYFNAINSKKSKKLIRDKCGSNLEKSIENIKEKDEKISELKEQIDELKKKFLLFFQYEEKIDKEIKEKREKIKSLKNDYSKKNKENIFLAQEVRELSSKLLEIEKKNIEERSNNDFLSNFEYKIKFYSVIMLRFSKFFMPKLIGISIE